MRSSAVNSSIYKYNTKQTNRVPIYTFDTKLTKICMLSLKESMRPYKSKDSYM